MTKAAIHLACNRIALGDPAGALEHLEPIRESLARSDDPWQRWRYGLHLLDARLAGEARGLVGGLAHALPDAERSEFLALGERLVDDPLAAYR